MYSTIPCKKYIYALKILEMCSPSGCLWVGEVLGNLMFSCDFMYSNFSSLSDTL